MFSVAICDDDKDIRKKLSRIIKSYSEKRSNDIKCTTFFSGQSLLKKVAAGTYFDLVFLDIELADANGIEIGRALRTTMHDTKTAIVYISSHKQYALNVFEIQPLDFVVKPFSAKEIYSVLDTFVKRIRKQNDFFIFTVGKERQRIKMAKIIYFESQLRRVIIHHTDGEIAFYEKLDNVEKQLSDQPFLRIHSSYLINYLHIKQPFANSVIMDDGTKLEISRSQKHAVAKKIAILRTKGLL